MPKGNPKSNYPSNQLAQMEGSEIVGQYVSSLMELSQKGRPETVEELKQRIDDYFQFCAARCMRPGVETLCLSLNITRATFWHWCGNDGEKYHYTDEWVQTAQKARQLINAFLETTALSGKLNPATSIFLLKNWCNYSDRVEIESTYTPQEETRPEYASIARYRLADSEDDTEQS